MRRLLLALALALTLSGTGCAYYNTFYLARKYYRQALDEELRNTTGKLSPAAGQHYEKAIKQCSKVLQRYSESKWADDAMLLMGQSYFGQGQYLSARRWLGELETRHPDSPLRPQAKLWTGRSFLMEEDYEAAARVLRETIDTWPAFDGRDDALFFLAETELAEERYAEAIVGYTELLSRYPKSARVAEAYLRVGDSHFGLKQYPEAHRAYDLAATRSRDPRQRVKALLKVGGALEKQERFDDALDLYDTLGRELIPGENRNIILSGFDAVTNIPVTPTGAQAAGQQEREILDSLTEVDENGNTVVRNPAAANIAAQRAAASGDADAERLEAERAALATQPGRPVDGNATARQAAATATVANPLAVDMPLVLLRQANALMEMTRYDDAIRTFEAVMASYPRTSESAEAQYRIGYIQEVYLEDFAGARVSYDAVRQHGQNLFVEQATRRAGGLARLVQLAAADSARGEGAAVVDNEAEKQFLAAELAYFQQDKPDKALEAYGLVETNFPGTSFAARSGLARAWLLYHVIEDTSGGRLAYEEVTTKYAGTEQARIAHQILYGEVLDDPSSHPDSLAIAAFEDSLADAEASADSLELAGSTGEPPVGAPADDAIDGSVTPPLVVAAQPPLSIPVAGGDQATAAAEEALRDSLADAREAARQASLAEAEAMAAAARSQAPVAGTTTPAPAGVTTPGTSAAAAPGTTPVAGAATPAPAGSVTPAAIDPEAEVAPITASRLAPEGTAGLPRPLSTNPNMRGPGRTPQRARPPVRRPAATDSTRPGGAAPSGRSNEDAHP